jgi:hypothetical protein
MTQTTEGTGPGSVDRVKSRILNGDVKDSNLLLTTSGSDVDLENVQLVKAPNGTEDSMDGRDLVIRGGEGYATAGEEDDADGGDVLISGGMQHGDGNSGDVRINGGDSSTEFDNSDAGDVILRGGDGLGPADSDGGSVTIRGGDCQAEGTTGEAGDVTLRGGNSDGSSGGNVQIFGGDSGSSEEEEEEDDNDGGSVFIRGGSAGSNTARGGSVTIEAGSGNYGHGVVYIQNLFRIPGFNALADLEAIIPEGAEENGMMCYVNNLNAFVVRANGTWVTLNTSPIE